MWMQIIGILGVLKFLEGRGKSAAKPQQAGHPPAVPIPPSHGAHRRKRGNGHAAHKPAALKPAAQKPAAAKPPAAKPATAIAPKPADPIAEILAMKPGAPTAAKPAAHKPAAHKPAAHKPAAQKPAAAKPAAPNAPPEVHLPKPNIEIDVQADASNRERTMRSAQQAARDLLAYVQASTGGDRGSKLGYKGRPNAFVQAAQTDMGGLTADGIYGPDTRARGKALLGKSFPPR